MLEQLQNSFRTSVLQPDSQDLSLFSSAFSAERLSIYRRSVYDNLKDSLGVVYPGLWKLLGDDCANSIAYALIRSLKQLPTSGCLDDWNSGLPEFIATVPELASLPYLRDYAEFEWAKHLSYSAPNCNVINAQALQDVEKEQVGELKFKFVPSLILYTSIYPIPEIQNVAENPDAAELKLRHQQVQAVITRPFNDVLTFWLAEDVWMFLSALKQGATLDNAVTKTCAKYSDFNPTHALGFMLHNRLIEGLNICAQ